MKILLILFIATTAALFVSCERKNTDQVGDESDHKVVFPASARDFQNHGDSNIGNLDRGIATMVVIDQADLDAFLGGLKITERRAPTQNQGDPLENGRNVWPRDAKTFVPGNDIYGGFRKTWNTEAIPIEMISCQSDAGDWLHVEIWRLSETKILLKLYTDWN